MKVFSFLFDLFGRARRRDFWLFAAGLAAAYGYLWTSLRDTGAGSDVSVIGNLLGQ